MVLQILVPKRGSLFQGALPRLDHPRWQRTLRANRRRAARTPAPEGRRLRAQLVRHWSPVAVQTRPAALPGLQPRERASASSSGLLRQCEGLLRVLCRHRLRTLKLRQANIANVARRFDIDRYTADGGTAALAYVLALMHWRGCSLPNFLLRPPLHPPTALVRWLSAFSVVDQVDNGQLLLEQLVREEARIFEHAFAIVRTMQRMKGRRARQSIVLLPELLTVLDEPKITQRDSITTLGARKINDLSRALPR
jgi:hypothetical protein